MVAVVVVFVVVVMVVVVVVVVVVVAAVVAAMMFQMLFLSNINYDYCYYTILSISTITNRCIGGSSNRISDVETSAEDAMDAQLCNISNLAERKTLNPKGGLIRVHDGGILVAQTPAVLQVANSTWRIP